MTLFNLNTLSVTLGTPLFTGLNLNLEKGDRIGLIAGNGRSKSTLLRCIAGTHEATSGEITRARGLRIGHLEQEVPKALMPLTLYNAVLSALPPEQAEYDSWRVDVVLDDLKVPYEHQLKPMEALSGGWQRIAMLARVWVQEPDLMLMDEPTNRTLFLRETASRVFALPYSKARLALEEADAADARKFDNHIKRASSAAKRPS